MMVNRGNRGIYAKCTRLVNSHFHCDIWARGHYKSEWRIIIIRSNKHELVGIMKSRQSTNLEVTFWVLSGNVGVAGAF